MNSNFLSPALQELIEALKYLPGIGRKTAIRLAFYILKNPTQQEQGKVLSDCLAKALKQIHKCASCQCFCEEVCQICSDLTRKQDKLCIVESMHDMFAIEESGAYKGKYFILHGHISPLDGIGPKELNLHILKNIFVQGVISELIIALEFNPENEVTSHFITRLSKGYVDIVTKLRCGVPFGGELEYMDKHTLSHAFMERLEIKD